MTVLELKHSMKFLENLNIQTYLETHFEIGFLRNIQEIFHLSVILNNRAYLVLENKVMFKKKRKSILIY